MTLPQKFHIGTKVRILSDATAHPWTADWEGDELTIIGAYADKSQPEGISYSVHQGPGGSGTGGVGESWLEAIEPAPTTIDPASFAKGAEAMRSAMDTVCREYGREQLRDRDAEKAELGKDYDMNCYGAGYSEGAISAATMLIHEVAALPLPTPEPT